MMKFWPSLYHIGASISSQNKLKIAVLKKTCKGWSILSLTENPSNSFLKKYSNIPITLSLKGSNLLIKSNKYSLKKTRNIHSLFVSELEDTLALPKESRLTHINIGKSHNQETVATAWVVKKENIVDQDNIALKHQLYPNKFSCFPGDLFYLAEQSHLKDLPYYLFLYLDQHELVCLLVEKGSVLYSRTIALTASDMANHLSQEISSTINHIEKHFPELSLPLIHFWNQDELYSLEGTLKALNKTCVPFSPNLPKNNTKENPDNYTQAIAAALHGATLNPIQFKYQRPISSSETRILWKKISRLLIKTIVFSAIFTSLTTTIKIYSIRSKVKDTYHLLANINDNKSLKSFTQIRKALKQHEQQTVIEKTFHLSTTILSANQTISLIASLTSNLSSMVINNIAYDLNKYPDSFSPLKPYQAHITLQGTSQKKDLESLVTKLEKLSFVHNTFCHTQGSTFDLQFDIISQQERNL